TISISGSPLNWKYVYLYSGICITSQPSPFDMVRESPSRKEEIMREKLYVFDNQDNLLTVTYNYITAEFEETVEKSDGLTIEFPMIYVDAVNFVGDIQVSFHVLKGNFRLFLFR